MARTAAFGHRRSSVKSRHRIPDTSEQNLVVTLFAPRRMAVSVTTTEVGERALVRLARRHAVDHTAAQRAYL